MEYLTSNTKSFIFPYIKIIACLLIIIISLSGCSPKTASEGVTPEGSKPTETLTEQNSTEASSNSAEHPTKPIEESSSLASIPTEAPHSFVLPEGNTLISRINTPKGFSRLSSEPGELTSYLRNMEMKKDGSPVLLYNGSEKGVQTDHVAVFSLDTGDRDLQQCADSIMRIYAEYYWSLGNYDDIAFHLTNGFLMEYTKWREGYRIKVDGNDVSWTKTASYDDSYDCFRKYLTMVFSYAGTLSLSQECEPIKVDEIRPGDLFLQGGSPGHCVLVVDIAEDSLGNRCFLLAQGYMPAQDFHVLKNPLHHEDPWYYESELSFPLATPAWTFREGSLVRWADFSLETAFNNAAGNITVPAMSEHVLLAEEETSSQISLLAVGDNLIHIEVVNSGLQKDGTYNYDHLYDNLAEEIRAADIAIVNQETILGGKDFAYSGYPNFNSPYEIGVALVNAGFDVVLHATNHTLDMGKRAVKNTLSFWSGYPEITVLGVNESKEQRDTIPIIERNGIKLAMLNYTYGLNGYKLPEDMPYLVNLLDKESMKADITKAKELADFVIVFPHWGSEYVYEATSAQKKLVEFYYEHGVDLVIGTHPHVLEPVEWIEYNSDHKMLVYYSLGNFMSYQKEAPRMLGGMAEIILTKDSSGTFISSAAITPIVTHYEHGPADYNYALYKLSDYTPELATVHGVSDIAVRGRFTYEKTLSLAKQVLGSWYTD